MDSDGQLVRRIQSGDRQALALLYNRHLPSVWRYVYGQLRGDDQTCRDVVSETFLAAIRGLGSGPQPVDNVGGWLIGIARHKLHDSRRSGARQTGQDQREVASLEGDPALAAETADTRQAVAEVMDQMDGMERTVLEWKYIEELSVHEMSQRLGRTEKAIEGILYRARNSFRKLFSETHQVKP